MPMMIDEKCKDCGSAIIFKFSTNYYTSTERCPNCNLAHVVAYNIFAIKEYPNKGRENDEERQF